MIGDVEETKKKVEGVTIGLIIAIFILGASLGSVATKLMDTKEFLMEEVQGLRNDMNREIEIIEREDKLLRERVKKLEDK